MCPHNSMTRAIGYMSVDLVKKISKEISLEHNLDILGLHGIGESLAHPKMREILEIIKEDNPKLETGLGTNGTFLTVKNFQKVEGLLSRLSVTIDGATEETYKKHRIGGDFNKVVSNVETILAYREKTGVTFPRMDVQLIDLGQEQEEKDAFSKYWRARVLPGDQVFFLTKASFGGQVPINFRIKKCAALFGQLSILWDGRLTTCCWDSDGKNVQGDVNNETIQDLWLSSEYMRMRQMHEDGSLQKQEHLLCHTCLEPRAEAS